METLKESELNHAIAGGFIVAAAMVVIGLLFASADGSMHDISMTVHDVAAAEATAPTQDAGAGYTNHAGEPYVVEVY